MHRHGGRNSYDMLHLEWTLYSRPRTCGMRHVGKGFLNGSARRPQHGTIGYVHEMQAGKGCSKLMLLSLPATPQPPRNTKTTIATQCHPHISTSRPPHPPPPHPIYTSRVHIRRLQLIRPI